MVRYYVYRIDFKDGFYYIGNHKSRYRHELEHDGYWGSGTNLKNKVTDLWVERWKNEEEEPSDNMELFLAHCKYDFKTACLNARTIGMSKTILKIFDNNVDSRMYEKELIKLHKSDPFCLNINH